jgi:hypothetical protein
VQIVENRDTQLSSLFLGPGDIFFRKVMTKTRFGQSGRALNGRVGFDAGQLPYKSVFVITFRKIVPRT